MVGFNRQEFTKTFLNLSKNKELLSFSFHLFDTIPSTNEKLWKLLGSGVKTPTVVIALSQTAGRGQWGRKWESKSGGLYLSLGISVNMPAEFSSHLTLCTAWGIATALRNYSIPVGIKWPNDLIVAGKKLGGIKSETRVQSDTITEAVIGVGINWKNTVPEIGINLVGYKINSLEKLGAITVYGILSAYQSYLEIGIEKLLPEYLQLLDSKGRNVMVAGCPGEVVGVTVKGLLRVRLQSKGASTEICLPPGSISLGYETGKG